MKALTFHGKRGVTPRRQSLIERRVLELIG